MKQTHKTSLSLTEDEFAILDATANRLGISRNEVMRHLILFQGMSGGDLPLTTKILALRDADRTKVVHAIREKCESGEFAKPAVFKSYMAEAFGDADPKVIDAGMSAVVDKLLKG